MCAWCRWMYGTWDPTSAYDFGVLVDYADRKGVDIVNFLGFWVSPDRGMLVWTPLLLVLVPAVVRAWRTLPAWSTSLLLGGVGYTLVQAALNRFSGGDYFYGYRLTLELLACSAPVLALSAHRAGRWARPLLGPVIGLQFCAMLIGSITKRFWVHTDAMWTDNAFWMAVRDFPFLIVPLAVVCMAAGAVLQGRLFPPQRESVPPAGIVSSHSVP